VNELLGIARFKFHEGKVDEYKRLNSKAMEIARAKDTGTLQYEVFFSEDQSEAVVIERYRSSQALIEHSEHLGDLSAAILATADVEGEVLGEASEELKKSLADGPVRLFTPFAKM
jgi:quinol monooxygenase YgiN